MAAKSTTTSKKDERSPKTKKVVTNPSAGRSSLSKITVQPRNPKPAPEASAPKEEVSKAPVETLDLLEPKKKVRKVDSESGEPSKRVLPRIGKIQAAASEQPPAAKEEPQPQATPEASPEVVAGGVVEDEKKIVHIKPPIIVKDLATQLGLKPFILIHDLMELNIFAAINQTVEPEVAAKICEKHGFIFEREKRKTGEGVHKVEVVVEAPPPPEIKEDDEDLKPRAPIVTFMGHVDHGKTSLLDSIRKSRVVAGEAGGITQHIGAYKVERDGKTITFLDTPGHAAFTAMRARGANVTDIVVIVVAADDGIMPQTVEAINHAKAAKVAIMVAINKVDLPAANLDRVKQQLMEHGLNPEDWGGDTICCPVSATKGTGIDHLLEMIMLQSEVMELKAPVRIAARANVIEAQMEPGRGPTATIIVRMGTLKVGQAFICGNYWGKVKQLIDDSGKPIKEAGPSTPVKVLGFSGLPYAGDEFVIMESEKAARSLGEERLEGIRLNKLSTPSRTTLENLFATIEEGQKKILQVVVKSDVQGSMEAIISALKEIPSKKVTLEIIHSAVGPISESDVMLASASNAVIIGFSVKTESSAAQTAKREGVQIKLYSIIYELIDQVKEAMAGLLDPETRETVVGHAEVKAVFDLSKGKVAGCMVTDGRIPRTARARLLRRKQPIYDGGIGTLKRFQDDVKEVRTGLECGIKLGDFSEYEVGDIIECYMLEKVPQQLA